MNLCKGFGLTFGNFNLSDKRVVFFLFSLILFIFVLYKSSYEKSGSGEIKMSIVQNKDYIANIDQNRVEVSKNIFYTPKLEFVRSNVELQSYELGKMGYSSNFFIDFETTLDVKEDLNITFNIFSDDGFNLLIDEQNIGTYKTNRPLALNQMSYFLTKGLHKFKLEYYQGVGNLGVKALYKIGNKEYFIGKDSDAIVFNR